MNIRDKILFFCRENQLSEYKFGEKIGLSKSQVSHLMNGRTKFNEDVFLKIKETYPELDMNALFIETENASIVMEDSVLYGAKNYSAQELMQAVKQVKSIVERFE